MGYISRVYYAVQIKITLENCQHLDTDTFINYSKKKKKKKNYQQDTDTLIKKCI